MSMPYTLDPQYVVGDIVHYYWRDPNEASRLASSHEGWWGPIPVVITRVVDGTAWIVQVCAISDGPNGAHLPFFPVPLGAPVPGNAPDEFWTWKPDTYRGRIRIGF